MLGFTLIPLVASAVAAPVLFAAWTAGRRRAFGGGALVALRGACASLAPLPLLLLASVYGMSLRVQAFTGGMPRLYDAVPVAACQDTVYQACGFVAPLLFAALLFSPPVFAALLLLLQSSVSGRSVRTVVLVFLAGWLLALFEPGRRIEWWLD